jgi:cell division protein FtsA
VVAASLASSGQSADVIGLLDIGTSKTVCIIIIACPRPREGERRPLEGVRVLGVGHRPSRGLKAGVVVDLDEAEQSVRAAVAEAEHAAGVALEDVVVAVACGRLKSSTFVARTNIEGRMAGDPEVERLMAAGRSFAERDGRMLLHMNCISYRLDGAGIPDPHGRAGSVLEADLHAVTADEAPLRNLLHVVERPYLSVVGVVPAPLAGSLAATTGEERDQGVLCIDMGAGTTGWSIFAGGHLLSNGLVPIGGNHVTFDIVGALSTTLAEAERIKKDCGTLARAAVDDREVVTYQPAGEHEPPLGQASKVEICDIVSGRVASLVAHLAEQVERLGFPRHATERVVLTGGASQLSGVGEFVAKVLARPVRVAGQQPVAGMPASFCGPAFSTATGLLHVVLDPAAGVRWDGIDTEASGYLGRMRQWIRESF